MGKEIIEQLHKIEKENNLLILAFDRNDVEIGDGKLIPIHIWQRVLVRAQKEITSADILTQLVDIAAEEINEN